MILLMRLFGKGLPHRIRPGNIFKAVASFQDRPVRGGDMNGDGNACPYTLRHGAELLKLRQDTIEMAKRLWWRTEIDPDGIVAEVRDAVRELDPNQPIYHLQTIDTVLSDSLARQKMTAVLLGIFALLALTLASIGIYGVIAYSVAQRTREIGVRMAVGASRTNILLLILREAAALTGIGILAGLVGAFVCAHFASTLMYHTSSADPVSICASVLALLIVGMLAAVLPAGRASTVNPTEALRSE